MQLSELIEIRGKTWLDERLKEGQKITYPEGFGEEVENAQAERKKFLLSQGHIKANARVTNATLKHLESIDLKDAANELETSFGKTYVPAPDKGRVTGTCTQTLIRLSGKYGVLEKSHEFTLVPWRDTMDRNLGRAISGTIKGQTISWTLTKGRGPNIS